MSVSLPIPEIKLVEKVYFWVPYKTSELCVKHSFIMKSHEPLKNLRKYIGSAYNVNPESFEIVLI